MKRRTGFSRGNGIVDEEEELIQMSSVIIVITREGYIKRMPLSSFKAQKRGGKGKVGATTRESDFVNKIYVATTLTPMLFFSDKGIVYQIKTHKLPEATLQSRGKAIVNLLPTKSNESISIALPLPQDKNKLKSSYVIFLTQQGFVRRNQLSDFEKIRPSGIIAMKLHTGDKIIGVAICSERDDILLTTKEGKAIRFPVKDIRIFKSRASSGIRGIKLKKNDQVLSLMIVNHIDASYDELKSYLRMASFSRKDEMSDSEPVDDNEGVKVKISPEKYSELVASEQFILAITEKGYGKRSSLYEYRTTKRGGSGIIAMKLTDKNGKIASSFPINTNDDIMLISDQGRAMRTGVSKIRIGGRNTQGVKVFSVSGKERVTSADKIEEQAE
jgi:DNA gyrase subunit A